MCMCTQRSVFFRDFVLANFHDTVPFEHSMLRVREIYALENVFFCIAVYGPYKP